MDREIHESTASAWNMSTEGWVTALRLVALSLRERGQIDNLTSQIQGEGLYLQEYLWAEIISHSTSDQQAWLLKISIVERFCAPLCEAVCQSDSSDDGLTGEAFLQWLQDSALFLIPLDGRGEWFRFHHLFQQNLQKWLEQQLPSKEIAKLHTQASAWFAENGLIDEALKHALAADDIPYAVQLVEQHRNRWMNTEQWSRLDSWLQKLSPTTLENNPKLLITQAWLGMMFHSQYNKWLHTPDQAAKVLLEAAIAADKKIAIEAEINALRTTLLYSTGEVKSAIGIAEQVLENLDPASNSMRGQTALILAMAQQGTGHLDQALITIQNTINNYSFSTPVINTKMLMGLCVVHWLEGNMPEIKQPALQLLRLGEEANLPESISFGRYFLGSYHYIRNELVEAETHFKAVVENRYLAREHYHAQCVFGLALCQIAQNRYAQARQVVASLLEYILETGNTWLYAIAQVFQAELNLRLNQIVKPYGWKEVADPNFVAPMYVFYIPKLTAARAMLIINTPKSRKDAANLLDHLHDISVSTHNRRVQIDVLALQALLYNAQDDEKAALEKLKESLALAASGGFIRNYIDMGPQMATLLSQLLRQDRDRQKHSSSYIAQILSAFPKADRDCVSEVPVSVDGYSTKPGLVDPLTKRELQTLKYLATELSTAEIAAEMYLAVSTVRAHTKNIYSKLNVHSRHEAVTRAKELGLL